MEELGEWKRIQGEIRERAIRQNHDLSFDDDLEDLKYIAGADISTVPGNRNLAYVTVSILRFPDLTTVHLETELVELEYPYIPGYLAFRESPALLKVIQGLWGRRPDLKAQVLLVDGNGQLHSREAGIASHLGVLLDFPTIGCAKSFFPVDGLTSLRIDTELTPKLHEERRIRLRQSANSEAPHEYLVGDSGKVYGAAILSGSKLVKNPIFVSTGHRVGLEMALKIVKACSLKYRVPEPIRLADKVSREAAQSHEL